MRRHAIIICGMAVSQSACLDPYPLDEAPCPCVAGQKCCDNGLCRDESLLCAEEQEFRVLSPNGGESWAYGDTHDIRWQVGMSTGTIKVEVDLECNGTYVTVLATDAPNTGTFSWTIRQARADESISCVRLTDNDDPSLKDESDAGFAIRSLFIGYPDISAVWPIGTTPDITCPSMDTPGCTYWAKYNVDQRNCDLQLSRDGGATYDVDIRMDFPCFQQSQYWSEVTGPATDNARVRLREVGIGLPVAESPIFRIQ